VRKKEKDPMPDKFINVKKNFSFETPVHESKPMIDPEKAKIVSQMLAEGQELAKQKKEEEQKEIKEENEVRTEDDSKVDVPDEFLSGLDRGYKMIASILDTPEQREIAKKLASPLDIGDLFKYNEWRQTIPIGDFGITASFRTANSHEMDSVYKLLEEEPNISIARYGIKTGLYMLTCMLRAIGDNYLPSHLNGMEFSKDKFNEKLKIVMGYPQPLIAALLLHAQWFELRVNSLLAYDVEKHIKNG